MPKQVDECVQRLLSNPNFNPEIGKGKTSKTKEETAWAICQAKYSKGKECMVCDIQDAVLFEEAVKEIMETIAKENTPKEQDYILEGIALTEFSEAISKEDLEKINKFAIKPVESKDVAIYTALLIDDKVTRNNTQYPKDFQSMLLSLPVGEGNFVGAPILFGETKDHQHTASSQVGRIFDAWQVVSEEKHFGVMAKVYVLREGNEDLVNKINSGVLKEMSIATKVELPICSVCGQDIRECGHQPGQNNCHIVMSGRGFVAEASFVAVPGSNSAKILSDDETKKFLKLENLKELVGPMITESIEPISKLSTETKAAIDEQIKLLSEKMEKITLTLDEYSKKLTQEGEVIAYKMDVVSTLTELKESIEKGKEFVVRNMAKYNLTGPEFKTDATPEITQGLKGEDVAVIVKLFYENIEIMGLNLSVLEKFLKGSTTITNPSYMGDLSNIPNVLRFMIKKMDNLNNRMLKLQGQFDLQDLERKNVITEAIKYGIICGKFNFTEKNLSEKFFEAMPTEEIVAIKEKFFTEGSAVFTPKVEEIKEDPKKADQSKDAEKPKASLREIAKKIVNGGKANG